MNYKLETYNVFYIDPVETCLDRLNLTERSLVDPRPVAGAWSKHPHDGVTAVNIGVPWPLVSIGLLVSIRTVRIQLSCTEL